jgi:uncharacterized protein YprB with RNaseH-like and TPR domain
LAEYYFDTETTGTNHLSDKIITIQMQELDRFTGEPIGDLQILKEWESSEKEILNKFLPIYKCENPFGFIPIGKNLGFDFKFLSYRAKKHGLEGLTIEHFYDRPHLDLKHVLVIINQGQFRAYDKVIAKAESLASVDVPKLYAEGKYSEILKYIKNEAKIFTAAYQILKTQMPSLRKLL